MPRLLPLRMLVLLAVHFSCQPFKDRFHAVATQCGIDPAQIQADDRYFKLESPEGEELTATTLLTTRGRIFRDSRGSDELRLSSRGCVRVQGQSGVLQAFSSAEAWSLARPLEHIEDRGLVRLRLQKSPRVSAELQCPTAGFFAHKSLPFPLRWTSDGSLDAARFEISAYDEVLKKSFVLFEKPYGQHLTELPQDLRTEDLPEGAYQLRLSFQISTEGWDVPGTVPSRSESCPLIVLHRAPEVGGLDGYALEDRVAVFAKGEVLPWKTPSAESDLHICRERRGQDLDDGGLSTTEGRCQPQAQCQDKKNFQNSRVVIAEDAGVFDYYAYAEDKAGNRSSLTCQTLVISDKKPELELQWSEESWNKPAAQMLFPRAQVELRILGKHPHLEDSTLAARYQCKADFVREDQSTITGRSVICTSGRCRNQSLANYVPCDPRLQLSIVDLWPLMKSEGGVLRIFVKADDRAGHSEERMASIGIQPRRWTPTLWSPTTTLDDAMWQLLQDRQGRIYTVAFNRIDQRNEKLERWERLPTPAEAGSSPMITRAWFSHENELHAQWKVWDASASRDTFVMTRRLDNGWQTLPSLDSEKFEECRNPQAFDAGGFWCSTAQGLALFQKGAWTRLPYPTSDSVCTTQAQSQFLVQDQAKTFWLGCNKQLFQKPEGESGWIRIEHPRPLVKIAGDGQGRLWTVRGTSAADLTLEMMDAGQTRTLPKPASFQRLDLRPEDFVVGPGSEIILGDAYWDETRSVWEVFPYLAQRPPGPRVTAKFLARGELVWMTEQGLWQWDGVGLRNWDLAAYDLKALSTRMEVAVGQDGAPWVLASPSGPYEYPYQFHLKKWVYYPKPNLNPGSAISGMWVDEASTPRIYIPDDGLYTLESGGWTCSIQSPGLIEERPLETDVFEPMILSSNAIFRWTPEKDWTTVVRFPEPRSYWGGTRDAKGRIWVYQDETDLGIIDGSEFSTVKLDAEAGTEIKGVFSRRADIVVATNRGLWSFIEAGTEGKLLRWQDFGLENIDRIRQLDADSYFVSVQGEWTSIKEFWILDLKTKSKTSFAAPEWSFSLGAIKKTSQGDYIMAIDFEVFRTDGVTYTKLFSKAELRSLSKITDFLSIWNLQVDASDRVWFDIRQGVVRID